MSTQCFPFDDNCSREATTQHIEIALQRLAEQCPQLAGSLFLGDRAHANHVFLDMAPHKIPLECFALTKDSAMTLYRGLKEQAFPPGPFVHPDFSLDGTLKGLGSGNGDNNENGEDGGNGLLPASRIRLVFVPGGFFLWIYLHHSLGDGHCLGMLIDSLAAQTRGEYQVHPRQVGLNLPLKAGENRTLDELMWTCPEYALLPGPTGPTTPVFGPGQRPIWAVEKTGKTFIFTVDRLEKLRSLVYSNTDRAFIQRPTIFVCLAALAWVHVTRARLETEDLVTPQEHLRDGKLLIPIDWSRRCFSDETQDYFGNTAATLTTDVSVLQLSEAYGDIRALARIVQKIITAISSVNQSWVEDRNALFKKMADPRLLGLNHDPRRPQELHFTTWRYYGSDAQWDIPGVPTTQPDAIRRGQGRWGVGSALILPARADSKVYELLVSLPVCSMAALYKDEEWMGWVDGVAGIVQEAK